MAARKQYQLLNTGELAPGFRLAQLDGAAVALSDLIAHGPVLLAFFKITCPVCQFTLPYLERIHRSGALRIYGISQNDPEDTREFNKEFRVTFPTLLDSEAKGFPASNDYGISHVPTCFLVGIDGKIERVIEGWNKQDIEALGASIGVTVIRQGENVPAWKSG